MITQVCVAIQLLGAPATPGAIQSLQQHCDSVLGDGVCRMTRDDSNEDKSACWSAMLVRSVDDAMASVVVGGSGAGTGHVAQRDVKFQPNDELTDRWATLGLVIAALVTQEEHAAATSAATAPAGATPSNAGKPWFSRDRSAPETATIANEPPDSARGPLRLADVRLLGVIDIGRLPWATIGARVAANTGIAHHLDLEIGFAYLASTGAANVLTSDGSSGVRFSLFSATLGLCPQAAAKLRFTGHVCIGADLAELTATSFGQTQPETQHRWLPNVWFGFDSVLQLSRHLALIAEFKSEVSVTEPPSVISVSSATNIDARPQIFQVGRFSENVALGVAGTF